MMLVYKSPVPRKHLAETNCYVLESQHILSMFDWLFCCKICRNVCRQGHDVKVAKISSFSSRMWVIELAKIQFIYVLETAVVP